VNTESESVEFKPSLSQIDNIVETVSAFSNTKDGRIEIGRKDDGTVAGIEIGKGTVEKLANQIKQNTDPSVYPSVSVEEIEGKKIIVIRVNESPVKPVLAFGRAFKRVGKSNHKLGYEEIRKLVAASSKIYWDGQICEGATIKDIDKEKVRWFLEEAKAQRGLDISENTPADEALMRLKLAKDGKLTNAALLLFGKKPDRHFTRPEVKCIHFKGTGVAGEMIDFKVVKGNLFDQLIEIERFIYNNIAMSAWIENEKLQRQEKWEYPPKAIREALANALCHREYETTSSVQVRIFDDRMEIWNPGKLSEGWTVETLRQSHESKPPNPLLIEHFFWVKYVEEVGTGTNKMIEWCGEWGLPDPDIEYTGTSLIVTFRKSKLTDEYLSGLGLNERQMKTIEYLKIHRKITSKKYAELFSITERMARNDIKQLVEKGIIERMGTSDKTAHYVLAEI
jgi:ATP-dependent DNA helicase RecG